MQVGKTRLLKSRESLEPLNGFEPMTVRLQGGCSTPELKRLTCRQIPYWAKRSGKARDLTAVLPDLTPISSSCGGFEF